MAWPTRALVLSAAARRPVDEGALGVMPVTVRRLGRWALLASGAALFLHGAIWAYAAERLEQELTAALASLRAQGWAAEAGAVRRAGWPFAAALDVALDLDGADAGVPVAWRGPVWIGIPAAAPHTLRIMPSGMQQVRFASGQWLDLTAASLVLTADGTAVDLAGQDVVLTAPGGAMTAAAVQAHAAGLALQAAVGGLRLPRALALPSPARLALDAALTQPVPSLPGAAAQAGAWRDAGGSLDVRSLVAEAGDLAVAASGAGHLDAALQPVLDLTAQVRGYRPALDRLVQAGTVPASTAVAAKAVLGLLSRRGADAAATVPLRLAGGVLTVAGFPLLRVPALDWTAAPR